MPPTTWLDSDTIDRVVTREFVCNRLVSREIKQLDRPLSFGDNLTDGTYWNWIEEKAKKIFLILTDLGLPDQIFGLIDQSWEDDDLPIPLEQVRRLALTSVRNEKVERKFYHRQFYYLSRPLQRWSHIDYENDELIPLDVAGKKQPTTEGYHMDKVTLPNERGTVFGRARIPLGRGHLSRDEFLHKVDSVKHVGHEHLLSFWASYTHQQHGYVLFTPATEFSLKSLLASIPRCLKRLDKHARRETVMEWIHCLTSTVCFLHDRGLAHGNITPSAVLFSNDNRIFLSDFTHFHTESVEGAADNSSLGKEAYDYAAPEQWYKPVLPSPTSTDEAARKEKESAGLTLTHSESLYLSPQAADIFSLGCVMLDLLSYLVNKKHGRSSAAKRLTKHKLTGRAGADAPDTSFQKNLSQVKSWTTELAKDASKKKDDPVFRGVVPILHLVESMLAFRPSDRPTADGVQERMSQILVESCDQGVVLNNTESPTKLHPPSPASDTKSLIRSSGRSQPSGAEERKPSTGGGISVTIRRVKSLKSFGRKSAEKEECAPVPRTLTYQQVNQQQLMDREQGGLHDSPIASPDAVAGAIHNDPDCLTVSLRVRQITNVIESTKQLTSPQNQNQTGLKLSHVPSPPDHDGNLEGPPYSENESSQQRPASEPPSHDYGPGPDAEAEIGVEVEASAETNNPASVNRAIAGMGAGLLSVMLIMAFL
ncbi:kinase-like domain-containing protein [Chaetomium strumarium]|uniref:Kinase-like domain-containing protein n=1 Tax=Chaetomium strumarium TaxID=1170767 RepID=A0AAJ0M0G1_9PEZI|nr:kinase-like domain-containing protein [Chaetomium strumarium]